VLGNGERERREKKRGEEVNFGIWIGV